jgi:hypothetical protein
MSCQPYQLCRCARFFLCVLTVRARVFVFVCVLVLVLVRVCHVCGAVTTVCVATVCRCLSADVRMCVWCACACACECVARPNNLNPRTPRLVVRTSWSSERFVVVREWCGVGN